MISTEETLNNRQNQNGVIVTNLENNSHESDRKVFDNIHGFIRFDKRVWQFIDKPEFQKLRFIKQLGCLSYVFPGATHTRFQHCLGTGHLAKSFIQLLIKNNPQRYQGVDIKSAIFTVTLAGIMHDIGHGPFSHTFDGEVVNAYILEKNMTNTDLNNLDPKQKKKRKWKHQHGSQILFRHIVQKYKDIQKIITPQQVERVVRLIHGDSDRQRVWQYELISNKQTGIDVDKLDYFRRDAFYLGAKGVLIDHELLMNEARIIFDPSPKKKRYTIGFPSKYALQVNDIFYSRYKLYKTYYLNNISKGIQFMVMDVLNCVQKIFQFNKICQNIKLEQKWIQKYVSLTDSILERIQFIDQYHPLFKDYQQQIKQAQSILKRIKNRDIYRFVREVQTSITLDVLRDYSTVLQQAFNVKNIKKFIQDYTGIPQTQYHVAVTQAGYGLKDINPLNKVKFFRKQDFRRQAQQYVCLDEIDFRAENISILYTKAFAQRFAKLYVKNIKPKDRVNLINEGFYKYFERKKKQCQLVFNHINMGRTHFYLTQTEQIVQYNPDPTMQLNRQETGNLLPQDDL